MPTTEITKKSTALSTLSLLSQQSDALVTMRSYNQANVINEKKRSNMIEEIIKKMKQYYYRKLILTNPAGTGGRRRPLGKK